MSGQPTLLLSPRPDGCAWLPAAYTGDLTPRCPEPPAYEITCARTGMTTQACVEHTALIRHIRPDEILSIRTAA